MKVFRVVNGECIGGPLEKGFLGQFASPNLSCIRNILLWNDAYACEQCGWGSSRQKVMVIEATKVRAPHTDEKNNHNSLTDKGEVIIEEGELIEIISSSVAYKIADEFLEKDNANFKAIKAIFRKNIQQFIEQTTKDGFDPNESIGYSDESIWKELSHYRSREYAKEFIKILIQRGYRIPFDNSWAHIANVDAEMKELLLSNTDNVEEMQKRIKRGW